jgi:hypothetical protein
MGCLNTAVVNIEHLNTTSLYKAKQPTGQSSSMWLLRIEINASADV